MLVFLLPTMDFQSLLLQLLLLRLKPKNKKIVNIKKEEDWNENAIVIAIQNLHIHTLNNQNLTLRLVYDN